MGGCRIVEVRVESDGSNFNLHLELLFRGGGEYGHSRVLVLFSPKTVPKYDIGKEQAGDGREERE